MNADPLCPNTTFVVKNHRAQAIYRGTIACGAHQSSPPSVTFEVPIDNVWYYVTVAKTGETQSFTVGNLRVDNWQMDFYWPSPPGD